MVSDRILFPGGAARLRRKAALLLVCIVGITLSSAFAPRAEAAVVSAWPSVLSVSRGDAIMFNVTLPQSWSLSLSGLPQGASYSHYLAAFQGTTARYLVRIVAGDQTPIGQYVVTVLGSGGGSSDSTTVQLTVTLRDPSSKSSAVRAITLSAQFMGGDAKKLYVSLTGSGDLRLSKMNITDQSNSLIFSATQSGAYTIATPELNLQVGKPYRITTVSMTNETLVYVIYCTPHVLECLPLNCWCGDEYSSNYGEYLDIFERGYSFLVNLTRNGRDINYGGVTINRVPWSAAYGGYGRFWYVIFEPETQLIAQKGYLSDVYNTAMLLSTRLHELAHAVLLETSGSDLLTQEGNACLFEVELFRLLEYGQGYIDYSSGVVIYNFQRVVGTNYSAIASEYDKSATHTDFGAWVVAYILQDFIGYGAFKSELERLWSPVNLVPDLGWDFVTNYFKYASEIEIPYAYSKHERLLRYWELASGLSLEQTFKSWGFNVSSTYSTVPCEFRWRVSFENRSYAVNLVTNSSLSGVDFSQSLKQIRFNVTGASGTEGFCNISVPANLMSGTFSVSRDGTNLVKDVDYTQTFNGTHYAFQIFYNHSVHTIKITSSEVIPEFPSTLLLMLMMALVLAETLFLRQRFLKNQRARQLNLIGKQFFYFYTFKLG